MYDKYDKYKQTCMDREIIWSMENMDPWVVAEG